MVVQVFRVEHKRDMRYGTPAGPYRSWSSPQAAAVSRRHQDFDLHPSPGEVGYRPREDERFGFLSLDDLLKWFDDSDRDMLHEANYHIAVYNAVLCWDYPGHNAARDGAQCTFVGETAELLDTLAIA